MRRFRAAILAITWLATTSDFSAGRGEDLEPVRAEAVERLGDLFGVPPAMQARDISIEIVPSREAAVPGGWDGLPPFAAGAAHPPSGRIILFLDRTGAFPFGDARQTLVHELSHVLLFRALGLVPPRWLDEGIALRVSGEWERDGEAASLLGPFAFGKEAPTLVQIEIDFAGGESDVRRSYTMARDFVAHLFPTNGDLGLFLREVRTTGSVNRAFLARFGTTPDRAFEAWRRSVPFLLRLVAVAGSPNVVWTATGVVALIGGMLFLRRRRRETAAAFAPDTAEPPVIWTSGQSTTDRDDEEPVN